MNDNQSLTVRLTDVWVAEVQCWIDLCDELNLEPIAPGVRHEHPSGGEASCSAYSNEDRSLIMETLTSTPPDWDDTGHRASYIPTGQNTSVTFTGTHDAVDTACKTLFQLFDQAELDEMVVHDA